MKTILVFSGSYSSNSINQQLVTHAASFITTAKVKVISLREFPLPIYSWDLEQAGFQPELKELRTLFDLADGFLVSVPEYNSSMPAAFKNTIDWLSRLEGKTFQEKPVLLMATSNGGRGGSSVLGHLQPVMPFWGAKLTGIFSLPRFKDNFTEGKLAEPQLLEMLKKEVAALENALNAA